MFHIGIITFLFDTSENYFFFLWSSIISISSSSIILGILYWAWHASILNICLRILNICLRMWLWLFFQVFFISKYIKMIYFFYFLKIIFEISTSKRSKTYKKNLFLAKNKIIWIFLKHGLHRVSKQYLNINCWVIYFFF